MGEAGFFGPSGDQGDVTIGLPGLNGEPGDIGDAGFPGEIDTNTLVEPPAQHALKGPRGYPGAQGMGGDRGPWGRRGERGPQVRFKKTFLKCLQNKLFSIQGPRRIARS